ncbi:hypothetical protein [Falsibacillus albus]|uniref:DUF3899 domain-containing protein n=1 Tax=Falsibacillus albus TaxID=2478915 RepID=A0A3L7JRM7_9BACI|nr:hypothetical protein [Falsibacillus albus]RLQ93326.1 hypothetical protein D9X91_17845 [Falsibacillus albus]
MKKAVWLIFAIIINLLLSVVVSWLFHWSFMEAMFLTGLLFLGGTWLIAFNLNQNSNQLNASVKGWNRQDAGQVKPFMFRLNPFLIGCIIYVACTFIISLIYYLPYFT